MPDDSEPIYTGDGTTRENTEKFSWKKTATSITCTRVFVGPWPEALKAVGKPGEVMPATEGEPFIDEISVTLPAPLLAEITVTASRKIEGGAEDPPEGEQPTYEVSWERKDFPISAHPIFNAKSKYGATMATRVKLDPKKDKTLGPADDGGELTTPLHSAVDATVGEWIEMMRNSNFGDRLTLYKALKKVNAGAANLYDHFFLKLASGVECYFIPTPIVRESRLAWEKPATTQMGRRGNPPGASGAPSGYDWLATADTARRTGTRGKWSRDREWTGVPLDGNGGWDKDLYA